MDHKDTNSADAAYFLASVVDSLQDSIVTIDLSGIITSWNKGAENLYGYPSSEAIGKSLEMVVFPADFNQLLKKIEQIRIAQVMPMFDTLRLHKDGRTLNLEISLSHVKDRDGKVIGISTVARDVTALRNVQERLAVSENQLRAILEAAIDFAIITMDDEGRIIDWTSGAELMFGYTRDEVIGQNTNIIFTPEDQYANISTIEIETARSKGRSIDERWHLHKDGTRFFMSGVMTPISPGSRSGFVKVARNITDRKLAEEALFFSEQQKSLAVQSAEMGEWEWDLMSDSVKISEQARVLFGWPKDATEVPPNALMATIYPPDEPLVREELRMALEGLYIFHAEYRIVRADTNEQIWVNAYGRVISHQADRPAKMTGVIYDITARKMLEKQKDDFIGLASHELKTPVTAIKAYSELLEENLSDPPGNGNLRLLKNMNGQVDRLTDLIRMLLDTSVLTEGRMKLYAQPVDLNAIIVEQVALFNQSAIDHKLQVNLDNIPIVHADRARISQVLTNFIANAIKYAPDSPEIIISSKDQLDSVLVTVQDFGPGIAAAAQPYLFERYYRAAGEGINSQNGFGLGLYICAEIVKRHQGTIGVHSVINEGSSFYFTLPYS